MKRFLMASVVAGGTILSVTSASALTYTLSFDSATPTAFLSNPPSGGPVTISDPAGFQATLLLPTWDTALGTLNSLTIATTINGSVTSSIFTTTGTGSYSGVKGSIPFTVTSGATSTPTVVNTGTGYADTPGGGASSGGASSGFSGTLSSPPNTTVTLGTNTFSISGGALTSVITGEALNPYLGAGGSFSLSFTTGSVSGSGTIPAATAFLGGSASEAVNVLVTYDYDLPTPPTDVPEPASMALLGAGLIGLGALRRRVR